MDSARLDLILLAVVLEACALFAYRWRTGRGPAPAALLANLGAGAALLLGIRLASGQGSLAPGVLLCLAVSGLAHVADLALRWRQAAGG